MDESLVLFIYQISSVIAAIVFNFNKILTLENDNKLLFYSLNRIFALSLHKIGGISAIQNKKSCDFRFALLSILIKSSRSKMIINYHSTRLIGFLHYLCKNI